MFKFIIIILSFSFAHGGQLVVLQDKDNLSRTTIDLKSYSFILSDSSSGRLSKNIVTSIDELITEYSGAVKSLDHRNIVTLYDKSSQNKIDKILLNPEVSQRWQSLAAKTKTLSVIAYIVDDALENVIGIFVIYNDQYADRRIDYFSLREEGGWKFVAETSNIDSPTGKILVWWQENYPSKPVIKKVGESEQISKTQKVVNSRFKTWDILWISTLASIVIWIVYVRLCRKS